MIMASTDALKITAALTSGLAITGGATVPLDGSEWTTGYVVAVPGFNVKITKLVPFWPIAAAWVGTIVAGPIGSMPRRAVGVWRDQETADVHLDVVRQYDTRGAAMAHAEFLGELAVWDVANSRELRVTDWVAAGRPLEG